MYKGESILATPRNKPITMGFSNRPKGLGRRNPHLSQYTKKKGKSQSTKTAIAISDGMDKLSLFFTGKKRTETSSFSPFNPFSDLISKLIKH